MIKGKNKKRKFKFRNIKNVIITNPSNNTYPMFSDNFIKVLNKLKVTENLLSDTEKKNLDAKGFIILENYLSTDLTKKILNNIEDIFEEEGPAAGIQKQNNSSSQKNNTNKQGNANTHTCFF